MSSSVHRPPPFVANTADDTHCFQAALKMVLSYFDIGREIPWDELDISSGKKEGFWTWLTRALMNTSSFGLVGELVVLAGHKYFSIGSYGDEYREFPVLLEMVRG